MAIINDTTYDIQDLSVLNLGHIIRKEFLKSGEAYLRMKITDSEAIQIAFDEITNHPISAISAETMEETIQQGVEAAFEESGIRRER